MPLIPLKPDECRILGVLVEKAHTTPQQYPLTLNALTLGCNQRNNRDPVVEWDDDRVLDAVISLRGKGLVREALLTGSRVAKYRHTAREALEVETAELVLLAELWLRGPQSLGDLRVHASRMHPLDSLEVVEQTLAGLKARTPACVQELPPLPGQRAKRYVQLLCPGLHRVDGSSGGEQTAVRESAAASESPAAHADTAARLDRLETRLAQLEHAVRDLTARLS